MGRDLRRRMTAVAMIDRLVHHAEILSLKGDSYRLRDKDLGPAPHAQNRPKSPDSSVAATHRRPQTGSQRAGITPTDPNRQKPPPHLVPGAPALGGAFSSGLDIELAVTARWAVDDRAPI
jgi:hypothetical protein